MVAFLFDFNGVLVDDEQVHFEAFRAVLARRGAALEHAAYVDRYLAFDDRRAFYEMLRDHGLPHADADVAECIAAKLPLYMEVVERSLVLFPGAFDLLAACARRGPVAIVSGALRPEIDFALAKGGASVPVIVSAEDVHACKPDPAGYLEGLRRLGVSADETVCIEDSLAGVRAGLAAGCAVAAVGHSYPMEKLIDVGAAPVVATIAELSVDALVRAAAAPRRRPSPSPVDAR